MIWLGESAHRATRWHWSWAVHSNGQISSRLVSGFVRGMRRRSACGRCNVRAGPAARLQRHFAFWIMEHRRPLPCDHKRRLGSFNEPHCARVSWYNKPQPPHRLGRSRSHYANANPNQHSTSITTKLEAARVLLVSRAAHYGLPLQ